MVEKLVKIDNIINNRRGGWKEFFYGRTSIYIFFSTHTKTGREKFWRDFGKVQQESLELEIRQDHFQPYNNHCVTDFDISISFCDNFVDA